MYKLAGVAMAHVGVSKLCMVASALMWSGLVNAHPGR